MRRFRYDVFFCMLACCFLFFSIAPKQYTYSCSSSCDCECKYVLKRTDNGQWVFSKRITANEFNSGVSVPGSCSGWFKCGDCDPDSKSDAERLCMERFEQKCREMALNYLDKVPGLGNFREDIELGRYVLEISMEAKSCD